MQLPELLTHSGAHDRPDPRRRQLARPRDAGGRARRAVLRRARRGRLHRDGRRPHAARLGAVVGAADLRPRRPRDGRGGPRGGARRDDASARRPSARSSSRPRSSTRCRRSSAVRLVSSGTEAAMSALRLARGVHPPRPGDQVRRLLPRPRRRVPRVRGLGPRDARHPELARRPDRRHRRHDRRASTTTSTASPRPSSATARGWRRSSSSRSPGTWAASRPPPGFLEALRLLCDATGALLVFDEVITGFRVARGGAQERFGVDARPDGARQDRRRRPAARRVRRTPRADGAARPGRRRLPGGDAQRQPARDRGRHLGAPPAARPEPSTRSSSAAPPVSPRGSLPTAACSGSARC